MTIDQINAVYPASRTAAGAARWDAHLAHVAGIPAPDALYASLAAAGADLPAYLPDLLVLEHRRWSVGERSGDLPAAVDALTLNPTVSLETVRWRGLSTRLEPVTKEDDEPLEGTELVLIWFDPREQRVRAKPASQEDLLALKIAAENIPADQAAAEGGVMIGVIDGAIDRAVEQGILLAPPSKLRRDPAVFRAARQRDEEFLASDSFTLQWHITQVCDLHCRHCYDRSERSPLSYDEAVRVLDGLRAFCLERHVQGAVSFTGGNPLLHPRFDDIYRAAVDRNFSTAILGNPAPKERISRIVNIAMPSFYQVSLEGLREHNDSIRGEGHFERIMAFLGVLRELKVSSMVMLTLTAANMDQVLPLAELLRDKTDVFHFNRLALFGEGANLAMVDRSRYRAFLEEYLKAAESNPVMGWKDSLINILLHERGADLFGGCAGYGCGAAFNFVTLLADGEVHACRKLPSPLGNIKERTFAELYDSDLAKQYRCGPSACTGCPVRVACGGCLAVAKSSGLDIFTGKDPFCFKQD